MKIAIDIDGTILPEKPSLDKYLEKPDHQAVEKVNKLFELGHFIMFFTARSWNEYHLTAKWLDDNGFMYHILICGKPNYDILIDDRSFDSLDKFVKL